MKSRSQPCFATLKFCSRRIGDLVALTRPWISEKPTIAKALEHTQGDRTAVAKVMGIAFRSMRYRMERLGIG